MAREASDLKAKILLAALDCSGGDLETTFTMEELLVAAWRRDPKAFGLRGFEEHHPDSERIHRELDSRGKGQKGLIDLGLLEKRRARVYRLTVKGLQRASAMSPNDESTGEKVGRSLEALIGQILSHDVFQMWLRDPSTPRSFREAGHFWGVAPGTPPRVMRDRIQSIEDVIGSALEELDRRKVDEMVDNRGRVLFDRRDLQRCSEFQMVLKGRFASDLRLLKAAVT